MGSIILGLGGRASALEADSRPDGLAVPGCHGDEFHEVKRDVFVAAGGGGAFRGFPAKFQTSKNKRALAIPPKADDIRLAAPIHPAAIHPARSLPKTHD